MEKDKAFIKTFDYYIIQNDQKIGVYPGHIEATPWKDASVYKDPEKELDFQVQVEVGDQVVLFDHIKVSSATIDKVPVKKVSIDETIESKYGTYTLSHLDVYPTGMYLHLTYDVPEDVYMFHLMDLKLESNDKVYEQSFISKKVDDTKKRWIRFDESFYYEDIITVDLSLNSLKVKEVRQQVSSPVEDLIGSEMLYPIFGKSITYMCEDVNIDGKDVTLNFAPQQHERHMHPMNLFVKQNNTWSYIMDPVVNEEPNPKGEQIIRIPTFVLNRWSGLNIDFITESDGKPVIIEKNNPTDPYYAYKKSESYSRERLELYIETFGWDISDEQLDKIFKQVKNEPIWLNKLDLEIISGLTFEELENSDEGQIKVLEYMADRAYEYRELAIFKETLDDIVKYGKIGFGGYTLLKMESVDYSFKVNDFTKPIGLGIMKVHMIYPRLKKTLEIK